MTEEWNISKLVKKLKVQYCTKNRLIPGDVIVIQDDSWLVLENHSEPGGFVSIIGTDGNGFFNSPGDEMCIIIDRNCLR